MRLSVRLPIQIERQLDEHCAKQNLLKSEAVLKPLNLLFEKERSNATALELGEELFDADETSVQCYVPYSKANLRKLVQSRVRRR